MEYPLSTSLASAISMAVMQNHTKQNHSHLSSKIREHLTKQIRENSLPYTIIADEVADPHSNCEIIAVRLRYVDLTTSIHV